MLVLLIIYLLSACTSIPTISKEEYIALTNRQYDNVTKNQVIKASEELLRLADGDDFKFEYTTTNNFDTEVLIGERNWVVYYVLSTSSGKDKWKISATQAGENTKVSVQIFRNIFIQGTKIYPPGYGGYIANPAIFDLFWARMDYLLGKRSDWMTCTISEMRVKQKIVWGDTDSLCNTLNIKDNKPNSPIVY